MLASLVTISIHLSIPVQFVKILFFLTLPISDPHVQCITMTRILLLPGHGHAPCFCADLDKTKHSSNSRSRSKSSSYLCKPLSNGYKLLSLHTSLLVLNLDFIYIAHFLCVSIFEGIYSHKGRYIVSSTCRI